jgi:hypothetical protein
MELEDFCNEENINCTLCIYYRNTQSQGVPYMSCDFMFAGGAYSGAYVGVGEDFACIKFERGENNE